MSITIFLGILFLLLPLRTKAAPEEPFPSSPIKRSAPIPIQNDLSPSAVSLVTLQDLGSKFFSPRPNSDLLNSPPLAENQAYALRNAQSFLKKWKAIYTAAPESQKYLSLGAIIQEARQELDVIANRLEALSPSPEALPHEATLYHIKKLSLTQEPLEEEPYETLLRNLSKTLREKNYVDLADVADKIFAQISDILYQNSLSRLNKENWVRSQLSLPQSDDSPPLRHSSIPEDADEE